MPSRSKILKIISIFILASSVCGCVTIYNPATEKRETFLIDTKGEVSLGADMDRELQTKLKFVNDPGMLRRVETIGNRVANFSDRQDLFYHFKVVKDKELNAFAIPGGFVYINSALVEAATDDELAGVIAHEIGHIAARHSVKQLQTVLGYQILIGIITGASGQASTSKALDVVFNLVNLGYSRKDELLADKLAVRYARRANYNPKAIITFFQKLQKDAETKGQNYRVAFLSSHPAIEERIANIEEQIRHNPY
jgi:predicted Zn-dependent protease